MCDILRRNFGYWIHEWFLIDEQSGHLAPSWHSGLAHSCQGGNYLARDMAIWHSPWYAAALPLVALHSSWVSILIILTTYTTLVRHLHQNNHHSSLFVPLICLTFVHLGSLSVYLGGHLGHWRCSPRPVISWRPSTPSVCLLLTTPVPNWEEWWHRRNQQFGDVIKSQAWCTYCKCIIFIFWS